MADQREKPSVSSTGELHGGEWTEGTPGEEIGAYDCVLDDEREVIVHWDPGYECEVHPHGEIIDGARIEKHKKIPGEEYRKPRAAV
jgi:hypothetical protein